MIHSLFLKCVKFKWILEYHMLDAIGEVKKLSTLCANSGTSSWKLVNGVFTSMTWAQSRLCITGRRPRRLDNLKGLRYAR